MKATASLLKIASAFFLVTAILGGAILAWRDFRDSSSLAAADGKGQQELKNAGLSDAAAKKALDEQLEEFGAKNLPGESALRTGGTFAALAALFALTVLLLLFVTSRGVLFKAAGALIVLSIVMILMNPQYETGMAGAASARNVAIVVGVLTIIGAVLAMAAARISGAAAVRTAEV